MSPSIHFNCAHFLPNILIINVFWRHNLRTLILKTYRVGRPIIQLFQFITFKE
jgi:hypothetical protein